MQLYTNTISMSILFKYINIINKKEKRPVDAATALSK